MSTKIFVNLPVKDLPKTMDFFTQLGYNFNQQFTDDKAACMVISTDIYVMLLTSPFFQSFTSKEIVNAKAATEAIICLSAESKEEVDHMVNKAIKAGGSSSKPPQDHGFMYERGFEDLDGHLWEIMWMDPAAVQS